MTWTLKYGEEAQNVEAMEASFQRVPDYLLNPVKAPDHLYLIIHLFWELHRGRGYFATGMSQSIATSQIEDKLEKYGFKDYEIEELKAIIIQIDREYCAYDNARIQQDALRHRKDKPEL